MSGEPGQVPARSTNRSPEARAVRHPGVLLSGRVPVLDQQEVSMKTGRRLAATLAVIALTAACGNDDGGAVAKDATTSTTAAPKLDRIVSISPTATEMLFAIGAGKQVVA